MRRSALSIFAALAITAALAGCVASEPTDPTTAATPTPSATPTLIKSAQGFVIKEIGEIAKLTNPGGELIYSFVVTGVELDPECNSGDVDAPINGHFLKISVDVETFAPLADEPLGVAVFQPSYWTAFGEDGLRDAQQEGNGWSCMDPSNRLPNSIGPAQKVSGVVVLDVSVESGFVALSPEPGAGWQWSY